MKRVSAVLAATLLTACGPSYSGQAGFAPRSVSLPGTPSNAPAKTRGSTLYVLNSGGGQDFTVTVYAKGGATLVRSIGIGKYSDGFTVDPSGNLYAGYPLSEGDPFGPGLLNIYTSRGAKLLRTLNQSHAFGDLIVDKSGNLFTLCAAARLCEYAAATQQVIRKISLRKFNVGALLAVDRSGDLAVSGGRSVFVFAPGEVQPYWTITGINSGHVAFDSKGNLFVIDSNGSAGGSVEVYAPGATSPTRTIFVEYPDNLALDFANDLFVLSFCLNQCGQNPAITVYGPGGSTPIRTVTQGLVNGDALSMVLDKSGGLYVSNGPDDGSVVVYAPGGTTPIRTIAQSIQDPMALGVSP